MPYPLALQHKGRYGCNETLHTASEQRGQGRAGGLGGAEVVEERVIQAAGADVVCDEQRGAVGNAHHPDGDAL